MRKQWTNLDALLAEAVDIIDPSAREAFLRDECAGDPEHLAQFQSMVRDYFAAEKLLDHPALLLDTLDHPGAQELDHKIGPYKLRELLGEGGMGSVYVAEQTQPVRRKVALKIIKPGMDSRQVISRFEAERQALALMDHPNIARVLDAGTTTTGRPYFVMELVKGVPITEFCDSHQLGTRERLELFIQVCQAVQHAHQKGIIHRDLKPSNILVTLHDTTPVVKVIDFGVAKAIGQQLTDNTLYTGFSQMLGTPLYMSPEQACQSGLDIDTRSDIYTLGVLLYELLTGGTPFTSETLKQAGFDEMRRIIREVDPPRPSARVSTLQLEALSTISQQRKMDPHHLKRQLRGELDWIVMKAIEKDRNRRYESASSLAMEIRRYLSDEPVLAGPPSSTYRLGKFARRNKGVLLTLSLVGLAIVAGGLIAAWQAWEARQARNDAQQKEQLAEANFQKALDAVDQMLTRLANQKLKNIPQMEQLSKEVLGDALKFYEEFRTQRIEDPEVLQRIGSARKLVGSIQMQMGQGMSAEDSTRVALEIFEDLHARFPERQDIAVELADTYDCMGWNWPFDEPVTMAGYHRQAVEILKPIVDKQSLEQTRAARNLRSRLGKSYQSLGARLNEQNKLLEAETYLRQAITMGEGDQENSLRISSLSQIELAQIFEKKSQFDKALQEIAVPISNQEKLLEKFPNDPFVLHGLAKAMETRGRLLLMKGDNKEAEKSFGFALDMLIEIENKFPLLIYFQDYQRTVITRVKQHYADLGNVEKSQEMIQKQLVLEERVLGKLEKAVELSPNDFNARETLFRCRWILFNRDKEKCFDLAKRMTEIQPDHYLGWQYLGECYTRNKKWENAMVALNKAMELTENPGTGIFYNRGVVFLETGQFSKAREDLERGIQLTEDRWWRRKRLAEACFHLGDYQEALKQLNLVFKEKPQDDTSVLWISPEKIAACPDESFKNAMVELAGKAVKYHKGSTQSLLVRGQLFASLGQMDMALRDFEAAVAKDSQVILPCYFCALLALNKGDHAKFRSLCEQMVSRFGDSKEFKNRSFAIWISLLMPDSLEDYSAVERIARRNLEETAEKKAALTRLGGALLRSGKLEEALVILLQAEAAPPDSGCSAYSKYFLTMVYQALGQPDTARIWLAKARLDRQAENNNSWNRKITLDLFDREVSEWLP